MSLLAPPKRDTTSRRKSMKANVSMERALRSISSPRKTVQMTSPRKSMQKKSRKSLVKAKDESVKGKMDPGM